MKKEMIYPRFDPEEFMNIAMKIPIMDEIYASSVTYNPNPLAEYQNDSVARNS